MAGAGPVGNPGDLQRPPGVAAEMAIGEYWPDISETAIQDVADEQRAAATRFSTYGETLHQKVTKSPDLLEGQSGIARVQRLKKMRNHAYDASDQLESTAVTAESYQSTVVGLKMDLTRIGDAAQEAWESAQKSKAAFSVAPFKAEAAAVFSAALGDIATAPAPLPMPGKEDAPSGAQGEPASNDTERDAQREGSSEDVTQDNTAESAGDAEDDSQATDRLNNQGVVEEVTTVNGDQASANGGDAHNQQRPVEGIDQAGVLPVSGGTRQPVMPAVSSPQLGGQSGVGSGLGSVRPPQMPSGLNALGGSSLKDAATAPASSMSEAFSSSSPLSSAASSFQSGLASGMGASGAVPVTSTPPLEKFAAQHPSVASVGGPGPQGPVVPAQATTAAAPSAPPHVGGGGMAPMVPPAGGGGLAPYVPPGGGGAAVPPAGAGTVPSAAQSAPPPVAQPSQQGGGGAPLVAGSSGAGVGAALPEAEPSAELVLARRILDGLVRGTEVREDRLNGGWVEWAVSVLALPTGQVVSIASTVGDGAHVPAGVVIPVSAQLAVYDRVLPIDWAHRFVGVRAAAELLTAHAAELARVTDVRPCAMVSSELGVQRPREWVGEFEAVRDAEIRRSPGEAPSAGGGYRHRLDAVAPDIWDKTQLVLGEAMCRRVAEAVAQTVLDEAKAVEADRPPMTPPLVDPYDQREVVERLGAGQSVDWDGHHKHVAGRGVLHPDGVLDADESEVSEALRVFYRHSYRSALIVEMLRCWRDQPVSLPDVAYCGWAAGFGHAVDRALNQALAVLNTGQRP